jgi:hypothetical protein
MIPVNFEKYLWGCDFNSLNFEKHKIFVTERILNFGNMESVKWVTDLINGKELLNLVRNSKNLDAKTKNYWEIILGDR